MLYAETLQTSLASLEEVFFRLREQRGCRRPAWFPAPPMTREREQWDGLFKEGRPLSENNQAG
jgi:hypothetical protein